MAPLKNGLTTSLQANLASKLRAASSSSPFPQTASEMNTLVGFTPTAMWDLSGYTDVTIPELVGSVDLVSKGSGTTTFDVAMDASVTGIQGTEGAGEGVTGVYSNSTTDLDKSGGSIFFLIYMQKIPTSPTRVLLGKPESTALGDRFTVHVVSTTGWMAFQWRDQTVGTLQTAFFSGLTESSDVVVLAGCDDSTANNQIGGAFTASGGHDPGDWTIGDASTVAATLATGTQFCVGGTPSTAYNQAQNDGCDSIVSFVAVFTGSNADGMYAARETVCDALWNAVNP